MASESRTRDKAALFEQYEDALFRAALLELEHRRLRALEEQSDDYRPDEAARARALRLIDRGVRKARWRRAGRSLRRMLPRAAVVAACVVLVGFAGLTGVLATSAQARLTVMNLLVKFGDGYAELSLAPSDGSGRPQAADRPQPPEGWRGRYYPGYMPRNYQLDEVCFDGLEARYRHRRGEEEGLISFSEFNEDTGVSVSSEDAKVRYVPLHGQMALLSVEPGNSFVTWAEGDRFFLVQATHDDEQLLLRIAESVRAIDR